VTMAAPQRNQSQAQMASVQVAGECCSRLVAVLEGSASADWLLL
jgi:hypothetical protein